MEFVKQSAPHIRRKDNLMWMLLNVIIALAPTAIWAAVVSPLAALRIFPLAIATCLLCEFLFVIITKKDPKAFKIENILSSIITGMIYGLCLPTEMSWGNGMGYVIVIFGAAIGIILGKLVFGGLGNNIFNPAALGMVVVRLFWGGFLSSSTTSTGGFIDGSIVAGGTSLSYGATYSNIANADFLGMFLGRAPGALGEGFHIAILVGLAYLLITRTIDWRVFVSYFGTFAVLMLVAGIVVQTKLPTVNCGAFLLYQLLSGGILFGAVFMITDPVTGPMGGPNRVLFGIFGGFMAVLIRIVLKTEGVAYSILFANMIAPVLDYPSWSSSTWKKHHFISTGIIGVFGILLVVLVLMFKKGAIA